MLNQRHNTVKIVIRRLVGVSRKMAVLLSLHKSIFTLLARNRPVYCKVRYEQGADVLHRKNTIDGVTRRNARWF